MRALKSFFLGRLLRERLMLVLFVALAVAWWASSFTTRATRAWRQQQALTVELATQQQWLDSREVIEAASQQAVKNLEPGQTLDNTRLVGELSALAREHNLRFTNETPQTDRSGQFAVHTVQVILPRADWGALRQFYAALARRSPYIGIESFSLSADRANPAQLNASLRVSSVEILR